MSKNKYKAIDKSLASAKVLYAKDYPRIVIMSDCHRGVGSNGDNFLPNLTLYNAALKHYYREDYAYIELGDGDELWENKDFEKIFDIYQGVYSLLIDFQKENRLFMVFGNHDRIKEKLRFISLCPGITIPFYESIKYVGKEDLYMVHGHQGDLLNDRLWKGARFTVRYGWHPLEFLGLKDPTGAAINSRCRKSSEKRLEGWSRQRGQFLIAGHTHRATLADNSKYLNCGCCVHPEAITAIEIDGDEINLVKWSICTDKNMHLYVCREVIGSINL